MSITGPQTANHTEDAGFPAGLHPQARRVLEFTNAATVPVPRTQPPSEKNNFERAQEARRAHVAASAVLVGPLVPVASSRKLRVSRQDGTGVPVRISVPRNPSPGVLVYLHGGGWVIGTLKTFDGVCRSLANRTGMTVVAVDYRLAPEHPHPAAIDDTELALKWIANGGAGDLAKAGPLVLAGDSAGGNLTASICLRARDTESPRIDAQVLIYPITDATMSAPSMKQFSKGLYLTAEAMQWYWDCYLQERASAQHDASVLHRNLDGLPPTLVLTAEFDPLRDEGEAFASRLIEAGNTVRFKRFNGMIHGFFRFSGLVDAAEEATNLIGEFLDSLELTRRSAGSPTGNESNDDPPLEMEKT
ncbi:alpha/beta hydrolase [Pseudarthrobacter sp. SSS035]|uniref:alpha/beta hydrolase n=1 Tax=Pseudarthrobacter sp. SSS035 TaxID=2931399 RepID=UPI00200C4022|nr:alpha/beta hydrolase [Pseudarthrobacter sp. SSS035]